MTPENQLPIIQVITDRLLNIKEQAHAMRACEWANSRERTDVEAAKVAQAKQISQELRQENAELLIRRRARMQEFLSQEAIVFEEQLNAMGLAFRKDD